MSEKIRAILTGGTGMLGKALLMECQKNEMVEKVLILGRSSCGLKHEKFEEILIPDFEDLSALDGKLDGINTGFFCMGISAAGLSEEKYTQITYSHTVNLATKLKEVSPDASVTYISGQGTDSSEKGRMMWARVKGRTENKLMEMFDKAYMFRPGYIQPLDGLKSRTALYNFLYFFTTPFFFLFKKNTKSITDTRRHSKAMIQVVLNGYDKKILDPYDINQLGSAGN